METSTITHLSDPKEGSVPIPSRFESTDPPERLEAIGRSPAAVPGLWASPEAKNPVGSKGPGRSRCFD